MGREIRRVTPNWQHPVNEPCKHWVQREKCPPGRCFNPLYDRSYDAAAQEWIEEFKAFEPNESAKYYWDWGGSPPDKDYYRPDWKAEEATWFQMYETVSEGTPVTPPFATQDELIDYLVTHGDFWDQRRKTGPWDRKSAENFVKAGWAPSMIGIPGVGLFEPKQMGSMPDVKETTK